MNQPLASLFRTKAMRSLPPLAGFPAFAGETALRGLGSAPLRVYYFQAFGTLIYSGKEDWFE